MLQIMAFPAGPSLPVSIRHARVRVNHHEGKADPIWDRAFTTKFRRNVPKPDQPLVTPLGAARVISSFLDRVAEIEYLTATQHLELATTRSEMRANGIGSISLSEAPEDDMEAANLADLHLNQTPYDPDPQFAAAMTRRIDWERYIFACGPVHKARFARTNEGTLGITYEGPSKDPAFILATKRALKTAWLDRAGTLPCIDDMELNRIFADHYTGHVVQALMTTEEWNAYRVSRMLGGDEDADPGRIAFHADGEGPINDVGYAGPRGFLGLDDDDDDDNSSWDEDSESAE